MRRFREFLRDEHYPWAALCEREFVCRPVQLIDERNRITHVAEFEGSPGRPLAGEKLVLSFDFGDEQVGRRRSLGRKGSLRAFRDAVLFKTIYAFGVRRQEAAWLDVTDFGRRTVRRSGGVAR